MEEAIKKVKQLVEVQGQNGNWNYSDYMRGMYNGMVCVLAVLDGKEPKYKEPLEKYLEEKLK